MSLLRWAAVCVPAVLLLGFLAGNAVPVGNENAWYQALQKSPATPPGWMFGAAWTALYVLLGLSLAVILNARGARGRAIGLVLFGLQLLLNFAWTPVFFGAHQVVAGVIMLAAILGLTIGASLAFGRVRPLAAWLLVPYMAWISFALALTMYIQAYNPDAERLAPGSRTTQML